jgi:regulatory factor X, other
MDIILLYLTVISDRINQVCDKGKGSVPRGRVYANYVSRCATERVTVLNPASFGKLVRVLFPGLKTRRLGVRGESKYHYVNFSLKEDQPELIESQQQTQKLSESTRFPQDSRYAFHPQLQKSAHISYSIHSHFLMDKTMFPSPEITHVAERRPQRSRNMVRSQSLYNQPLLQDIHQLESSTSKTIQKLRFEPPGQSTVHEYEPISLPKIEPYVPVGTDLDAATALTALYRSHCTSLVDAIRFVKQKTFFHLFTSFHGTLTMPVQKLFSHPSIAPWIEECDFVMYQKMMRVVAHLTLEVVPQAILDIFREISSRLVSHIQNAFHGQPSHVIQAKVAPATLFAGLLDRMCRVNLTAHAAANMLCHPPNRDQMYEDWIGMVRLRKVAECVPTRAMDDVVNLILTELRGLLDPVSVPWEVEGLTPYGEMALRSGRQQQSNTHTDISTENVLDRWVNFLASIPGRFPYATPAEIVWCVQRVGTAVMRDLTINSGQSFGAWWVTKCWIDEMISFMAEKGGFMECKTTRTSREEASGQPNSNGVATHIEAQYSSGGEDFNRTSHDDNSVSQSISIPCPMDTTSQAISATAGHDDSGIGMRSDEDFLMSKYEFSDTHIGSSVIDGATRA